MGWTRQEVLDVARSTGQPVVEAWSSHDAGQMGTVVGPMLHHTGSTWVYPSSKAPTLRTVREGRADLQNALCMYYIDYEGVIYCVTEKIAWHAGGGSWQGITDGNGHYAGIEAESNGVQWTAATVVAYKKLTAAILRKAGRTIAYAPRHAEYALPKGRKTDFSGMDATAFRADVAAILAGTPLTPVSEEDDEMPYRKLFRVKGTPTVYLATEGRPLTPIDPNYLGTLVVGDEVKVDANGFAKVVDLPTQGHLDWYNTWYEKFLDPNAADLDAVRADLDKLLAKLPTS